MNLTATEYAIINKFSNPLYPMKKGDRVRIKEGYDGAGQVGFYLAKSKIDPDGVVVEFPGDYEAESFILAAAIEPYPYTREERIERAIEDLEVGIFEVAGFRADGKRVTVFNDDERAVLYAILDAGV